MEKLQFPNHSIVMKQYTHLSQKERENIYLLESEWMNLTQIARQIGRNKSTLSREYSRNRICIQWSWAKKEKTKEDSHYLPDTAQKKYMIRRKQCKRWSPLDDERIREYIIRELQDREKRWSPEIIATMMKQQYPDDPSFRIAPETIYQFIYSKRGENLNLKSCLLRSHRRRKKKMGRGVRSENGTAGTKKKRIWKIVNRVDIDQRPEHILRREEFGHWEGDSVVSGLMKGYILHTEVERKSRFLMLQRIEWKTAEATTRAILTLFSPLSPLARLSQTLDNGTENAGHETITRTLWHPVYYAKPYHSWERGTNENLNGMIRRYFPKGTNFSLVSEEELQRVVFIINNRPRKILWWKTSQQVFDEEMRKIQEIEYPINI